MAENETIGDHYEVQAELGAGSIGATFVVLDRLSRAKLALKCLRPPRDESDAAKASLDRHKERFAREVSAMIKLDHPSIVRIYDCDVTADNPYYVMELCSGGALDARIAKGDMDRTAILSTLWPVCSALQYAHSEGVVHRDIKPANILFASDGHPKVSDFGMCRIADWHTLTCGDDSMLGTLYYIPPEQAQDPKVADERSDVFSLGRTIRHMLVGSPIGTTPPSQAANPKNRRTIEPWDSIVAQMTALPSKRRPRSMKAVGRLLEPLGKRLRLDDYAKMQREVLLSGATPGSADSLQISRYDLTRIVALSLTSPVHGPMPFIEDEAEAKWFHSLPRRLGLHARSAPLLAFLSSTPTLRSRRRLSRLRPSRVRRLMLDAQREALLVLGPRGAKYVREYSRFALHL